MTDDQCQEYQTYLYTIRRLLLFIGLWPSKWGFFQRLLFVINIFFCAVMCFVILNFCRHHLTNLSLSTRGISIGASFGAALLKMTCIVVRRKNIVDIHETLENYFGEELANIGMRSRVLSHITTFKRPSFVFIVATFGLGTFLTVTPALSMILQRVHGVQHVKYLLIFPAKYPWTVTGDRVLHAIHYIFEAYATLSLSIVTAAVDGLFGFYVFQMTGILSAIGHRMANLSHLEDYKRVIRECVQRHQAIAHCRDSLERIYGPVVMYIIVTSSVIICALIFQATLTGNLSVGKLILFALYIGMKLLQTLLYSWYGTILTTESEKFYEAVYASGWPGSQDKSFTTDILIIMTQRPLVLTACSLSKISMDMFIAVFNTALSYFFLLQTLDEKA